MSCQGFKHGMSGSDSIPLFLKSKKIYWHSFKGKEIWSKKILIPRNTRSKVLWVKCQYEFHEKLLVLTVSIEREGEEEGMSQPSGHMMIPWIPFTDYIHEKRKELSLSLFSSLFTLRLLLETQDSFTLFPSNSTRKRIRDLSSPLQFLLFVHEHVFQLHICLWYTCNAVIAGARKERSFALRKTSCYEQRVSRLVCLLVSLFFSPPALLLSDHQTHMLFLLLFIEKQRVLPVASSLTPKEIEREREKRKSVRKNENALRLEAERKTCVQKK